MNKNINSLRFSRTALAAITSLFALQPAQSATLYWDTNGATAGSGVTPNGTWGTDAFWSTSSAGTVATSGTGPTAIDQAAFSAGTDASGPYTVTLNGTQTAQSVYARTGGPVILSGGTLALANTTSPTLFNFQTNGPRQLTVNSNVSVNNSVTGVNYLTFGSVNAAGGTITINGTLTATNNDATKGIYIRQVPNSSFATNVIFNSDLGTDAAFRTALQAGNITGASSGGTMTFNGSQNLGTTGITGVQAGGILNFGGTVNTGNAVTIGTIILNNATADMSTTIINMNSAVTMGSTLNVRNGGVVNIAGSLSTGGQNTFLGSTTASETFHGGSIKILNGGSGTFGAVSVRDSAVFTNAGTMTGALLTLGEATNNTSGRFVLGDATGVGTTILTGLATAGTGTANAIVGGNSSISTLTVNTTSASTFNGAIGGAGANQNNVTLIKAGASTLTLGGSNTYLGNTTVTAGSLILADNGTLAFSIGASGVNNGIGGTGILNLNGDFTFDLTGAAATGSWNIVDVNSLTETFGSTFTVLGFTDAGGNVWTKIQGDSVFTFNEATGLLTAVPEPGIFVQLVAVGACFLVKRRRRS